MDLHKRRAGVEGEGNLYLYASCFRCIQHPTSLPSSSILYPSGAYGSQRVAATFNLNTQESEGFDLSDDKAKY